MGNIVRAL